MKDWQVPIYIQAMAEMARLEAMKALNSYREQRGESQGYNEESFYDIVSNLETLARDARV